LKYKKAIQGAVFVFLLLTMTAGGQPIAFHHLNTSNGLSDNNVTAVTTDRNGFLWIGTSNGLHLYDGRTLTLFTRQNTPGLFTDQIGGLICDSRNRIWVGTIKGVTMIDEKRQFHKIIPHDTITGYNAVTLVETRSYGVIILSDKGHFYFNEQLKKWELLAFSGDILLKENFTNGNLFSPDTLLVCGSFRRLIMIDYGRKKEILRLELPDISTACKLNDTLVFAASFKGYMYTINIKTGKIEEQFSTILTEKGRTVRYNINKVRKAVDGRIIITTRFGGIFIFDPQTKQLAQYRHKPYDPLSVASDWNTGIHCEDNGNVFISSPTSGLSFFNRQHYSASHVSYFVDQNEQLFDGHINAIAKDRNNRFWLAAYDRLINWDPQTNSSVFYEYPYPNEGIGFRKIEINSVCVDRKGQVWVATDGGGIGVMQPTSGRFRIFNNGFGGLDSTLRSNFIAHLTMDQEGMIWACGRGGVYKINPLTLQIDPLSSHPVFKQLVTKRVNTVYVDRQNRLWLGTAGLGAWCWDPATDSVTIFNKEKKLVSDNCYSFIQAADGAVYIGSPEGMSLLQPNGSIDNYTQQNGLWLNRCEGFLEDKQGYIWIGNDMVITCFNPRRKSFRYFDSRAGLGHFGFRPGAHFNDADGIQYWGSEKGISFFDPRPMLQLNTNPNPLTFKVSVLDSTYFVASDFFQLPFSRNNVAFHFAAVNVFGSRNIFFQYMLEGTDKTWTTVMDQNEVRYNSLRPGKYSFRLKASSDGVQWVESKTPIRFAILAPWWRKWWAITTAILGVLSLSLYLIRSREKVIRRREAEKTELQKLKTLSYLHQLEIEQVVNYFATLLNEKTTIDEMLWDTARNCIARLGFEDCVIYLLDKNSGLLVQKAAWGPKTTEENKIMNPIEIKPGEGIVGSVALSGKPEIINDTTKDPRYIVDDVRRYSEITVPVIRDGKVIGIIDSEHSQKGFYTDRHLQILTTIAALLADKMVVIEAELHRQQAQLEALLNKQKATEARLQSMRLQMNPHFLFNALNSIQQMILAGEETTATRFLSKFSRLLRLVLTQSDREKITLKEELEILKLYVELESLRFKESFEYRITCDAAIDQEETYVPTLFFQPFVENALWHGLLHKEGHRRLMVHFSETGTDGIQCIVEDNGIGLAASKAMKEHNADARRHTGKGVSVGHERLKAWNEQKSSNSSLSIIDLQDAAGNASGTRVIIHLYNF
jgi:putative methionine-R-sulfoxide reductase with GAF domain/streptogramin lyase